MSDINIAPKSPSTAVALSGGGHRASIFGLGVLLYLYEAKKNESVVSISSVSGGSITNGYIGKECDFRSGSSVEFIKATKYLWDRLTSKGILFSSVTTKLYLLCTVVLLLLTAILPVAWIFMTLASDLLGVSILSGYWKAGFLFVPLLLLIPLTVVLSIRGKICRKAFAQTLFCETDGKESGLNSLSHKNINHVICATELHAGEHIYFAGNFVYSYRFGLGSAECMSIAEAVQASTAYAPLLPPVWKKNSSFSFFGGAFPEIPSKMLLTDGGAYNNMGEQWPMGLHERKKRLSGLSELAFDADDVFLVNATASLEHTPLRWFHRIPFLGESTIFYRIICTLFDQTTAHRRKSLFHEFREALLDGKGMRGIMVMLEHTPFTMLNWICTTTEPQLQEARDRADAILSQMPADMQSQWEIIKKNSINAPTTLCAIKADTAKELIYHSFIVAMVNAHVLLGYPFFASLLDKDKFNIQVLQRYL